MKQFLTPPARVAGHSLLILTLSLALACQESNSPGQTEEAAAASGTPRIVDGDGLRLRNRPGREGAIMGVLYRGDTVHELRRSEKSETIGGASAPWVQVRTAEGTIGWVFGGFLKDPAGSAVAKESTEEKSEERKTAKAAKESEKPAEKKTGAKAESASE